MTALRKQLTPTKKTERRSKIDASPKTERRSKIEASQNNEKEHSTEHFSEPENEKEHSTEHFGLCSPPFSRVTAVANAQARRPRAKPATSRCPCTRSCPTHFYTALNGSCLHMLLLCFTWCVQQEHENMKMCKQ